MVIQALRKLGWLCANSHNLKCWGLKASLGYCEEVHRLVKNLAQDKVVFEVTIDMAVNMEK